MISFINNSAFKNIKYKLLILYLLNVADICFTLILLSTNLYVEANILMAKAVESISSSFILKIILPAVLLFYLYIRMKKASEKQLKQSNFLLNVAMVVYAVINITHLLWFLLFGWVMLAT